MLIELFLTFAQDPSDEPRSEVVPVLGTGAIEAPTIVKPPTSQ